MFMLCSPSDGALSQPHRLDCFHFDNTGNCFFYSNTGNNNNNNNSTSNKIMMHGVRVGRSTDRKVKLVSVREKVCVSVRERERDRQTQTHIYTYM